MGLATAASLAVVFIVLMASILQIFMESWEGFLFYVFLTAVSCTLLSICAACWVIPVNESRKFIQCVGLIVPVLILAQATFIGYTMIHLMVLVGFAVGCMIVYFRRKYINPDF